MPPKAPKSAKTKAPSGASPRRGAAAQVEMVELLKTVGAILETQVELMGRFDRLKVELANMDDRFDALGFEVSERIRELRPRLEAIEAHGRKMATEATQSRATLLEAKDEIRALRAKAEYIRTRVDATARETALAELERRLRSVEERLRSN